MLLSPKNRAHFPLPTGLPRASVYQGRQRVHPVTVSGAGAGGKRRRVLHDRADPAQSRATQGTEQKVSERRVQFP